VKSGAEDKMTSNDTTSKPAGEDTASEAAAQPLAKPKRAGFDFAGANQSHLKSMSAMRGRNAGPMKKAPPRR